MARFSKLHHAFGYFHCQADHYRSIFNKLCAMRDADVKAGNLSGGMPTGFRDWAWEDLKSKANEPFYTKQIQEHLNQLELTIEVNQKATKQYLLSEKLTELEEKKTT